MSPRRFVIASILIGAACTGPWAMGRPDAAGPWKSVLLDPDYQRLVADELKLIHSRLDKGLAEKKNATKAKVSAVMVAAFAQSHVLGNAAGAKKAAMIRDTAVQLARAAGEGDAEKSKKALADVEAAVKGD